VQPYRRRLHEPEGRVLHDRLAGWARGIEASVGSAWPEMPDGIADRDADVWEPLLAVADAAGGDWPARSRLAAVALVRDVRHTTPSLGVRLLADLQALFPGRDVMFTVDIIGALVAMEEAPWGDLRGKPLDDRGLARLLKPYGVKARTIRVGSSTRRAYAKEDLRDPWTRYLPRVSPSGGCETSKTSETSAIAPLSGAPERGEEPEVIA
jgi:hypothetical protein